MNKYVTWAEKEFQGLLLIYLVALAVFGPAFAKLGISFQVLGLGSNPDAKLFMMGVLIVVTTVAASASLFLRKFQSEIRI